MKTSNSINVAMVANAETFKIGLVLIVTLGILYQAWVVTYNLFSHPLRRYPGPLLCRASGLPWAVLHAMGQQALRTQRWHGRYGPVVRVGPNHLTFTDPRAIKDIYGQTRAGQEEMGKSPLHYRPVKMLAQAMVDGDREVHSTYRRAMSHGFSEASIRTYEPRIARYIDGFIGGLYQLGGSGEPVNIEAFFNYATFDIMGDLIFGLSFGCLRNLQYHPWVERMINMVKGVAVLFSMHYVGLGFLVNVAFYTVGNGRFNKFNQTIKDMLKHRLDMDVLQEDIFEGLVRKRHELGLSIDDLTQNAHAVLVAGSETTATLLSGCTYLLLKHPDKMSKLKEEIRTTFETESEINFSSVNQLEYMLAVLSEALRMYPPVPSAQVRVVPLGGRYIAGEYVPAGTLVEVQQWSINHSPDNWSDPWAFRPERFLCDGTGSNGDALQALQPFSIGPRNCIGRNLAYAEMRYILARMIWNFDLALSSRSQNWIERQRNFAIWERIPLQVRVTPADGRAVVKEK